LALGDLFSVRSGGAVPGSQSRGVRDGGGWLPRPGKIILPAQIIGGNKRGKNFAKMGLGKHLEGGSSQGGGGGTGRCGTDGQGAQRRSGGEWGAKKNGSGSKKGEWHEVSSRRGPNFTMLQSAGKRGNRPSSVSCTWCFSPKVKPSGGWRLTTFLQKR